MGIMHSVTFREPKRDLVAVEEAKKVFFQMPFDPRFPNQNQTRNCYQNYLDYHRCHKLKGDDHQPCEYFKKVYTTICHKEWHEEWDEQREEGTFPGRI